MKIILSFISIICLNFAFSQENQNLKSLFISEFVKNNIQSKNLFIDNTLYIFGSGQDFLIEGVKIDFLNLAEVKQKVKKTGEFNLVTMQEITIEKNKLKSTFLFLIAKKNFSSDFATLCSFENSYCVEYSTESQKFVVYSCEYN